MVVKENQIQRNATGFTMKTHKDNIPSWTHDINEWFVSLDYKVSEKTVNEGQGHQLSYTLDNHKFTFIYYPTGRVTIKASDTDKLRCVNIDNHEKALGVKLIELSEKRKSISDLSTIKSSMLDCSTPRSTSKESKSKTKSPTGKVAVRQKYENIRVDEIVYGNLEEELLELKNKVTSMECTITHLSEENKLLHEAIKPCRCSTTHTTEEDIITKGKLDELLNAHGSNKKRLQEAFEQRITNSNRNINLLQLEMKIIRQTINTFNESTCRLSTEIDTQKKKIYEEENRINQNRQRVIDIEQTLSSEFHTKTNIYTSQPEVTNHRLTTPLNASINTSINASINNNINNSNNKEVLELLVIGSSIMKFVDAKRIEKRDPEKTKTICIPGAKTEDVVDELKKLKDQFNIKKMIIHIGANHTPEVQPVHLEQTLFKFYDKIRNMFPETIIYNSAMIPRNINGTIKTFDMINRKVATYCNTKMIKTIKHWQFENENNFQSLVLRKDLLHPTNQGTKTIAMNFIAFYRNYQKVRDL